MLQFPPSVAARPQDYGLFSRELSADELAGCFCFSDDDQRQIARRRRDVNRLGFAVQLGTVRYLGRFLENPAEAPEQVVHWTAREIGVPPSTNLAGYGKSEALGPPGRDPQCPWLSAVQHPGSRAESGRMAASTSVGDRGEPPRAVRARGRVLDRPSDSAAGVEHAVAARRRGPRERGRARLDDARRDPHRAAAPTAGTAAARPLAAIV